MDCPNQESLTTHNSKYIYPPLAKNRANTHQLCGIMKIEILNSV